MAYKLPFSALTAFRAALLALTLPFVSVVAADGFVDELDSSSIFLSSYTSGGGSFEGGSMLTLTTESQTSADSVSLIGVAGDTDSIEITTEISSDSDFIGSGRGRLSLFATLFNDTQDGGHSGFDGDMVAGVELLRFPDGYIAQRYCLWRKDVGGSWQSTGFFNGSSCLFFPVTVAEDTEYEMLISVDRAAGTLTFGFDVLQSTYTVTGAANQPSSNQSTEITNRIEDVTGEMVATVLAIETDLFDTATSDGFANVGRYDVSREEPGAGNVDWNPGEVELMVSSDGTENKEVRIRLEDIKDSLSARLLVSSNSVVDQDFPGQRFAGTVSGFFYNDIADNGIDGGLGDVFASTEIALEANGGLTAYYCIFRSNAPDYSDFAGLLAGGTQDCIAFSTVPAHDTYYTVSVAIDRIGQKLLFSFNGETAEYNIQTSIYQQSTNFRAVRSIAFSEGGIGTSKVKVDRIETTDLAQLCNGLPTTVFPGQSPTTGDDVILGTAGADIIVALGGNDTICGLGGNDTINAGLGDDWVDAGAGDDSVFSLDGADVIYGGDGADIIVSGNDDDLIHGEDGDDTLNSGPGNDMVYGGNGADDLFGQGGDDILSGGAGNDFVLGVDGVDDIDGGDGNDVLNGGPGNDTINGGNGMDIVYGLTGDDTLDGGLGDDQIFGQLGDDIITGGAGNDQLFGNQGNDVISVSSGSNVINGGPDNDTLTGGSGDDSIFGDGNLLQAGDDIIDGGAGVDLIVGFAGQDTITSTDGEVDTVNGGPDADVCTTDGIDTVFNCP